MQDVIIIIRRAQQLAPIIPGVVAHVAAAEHYVKLCAQCNEEPARYSEGLVMKTSSCMDGVVL